MTELIETEATGHERAILVGVYRDSRLKVQEQESMEELAELAESAGARVVDQFIQEKTRLDAAHLLGQGKLDEIGGFVKAYDADLVVFNQDLTPAQLRNLEQTLETKVLDRSELILDIFAQRARSREGKLQVELAQLEYTLPRLTGKGVAMSRLGGGIGTRGPGETKLEVDRRRIRLKISKIKEEIEKLEQRRQLHRQKRKGVPISTTSLVGYTNAGKSTLFNRLTSAETYASPRLFATLDPLVRRLELPSGKEALLADTVGFIRRLPHTLVAAFHATLEETLEADLILHVIDAAHPNHTALRAAVYEVLDQIGYGDRPILEVYNKTDLLPRKPIVDTSRPSVFVSAKTGDGCADLLDQMEAILSRTHRPVHLTIPLDRGDIVSQLRERARIESQDYREDGVHLLAFLSPSDLGRFQDYVDR